MSLSIHPSVKLVRINFPPALFLQLFTRHHFEQHAAQVIRLSQPTQQSAQ
jgi:hypothetical protein